MHYFFLIKIKFLEINDPEELLAGKCHTVFFCVYSYILAVRRSVWHLRQEGKISVRGAAKKVFFCAPSPLSGRTKRTFFAAFLS